MRNIGEEVLYDCVRVIRWTLVKLFGLIGSAFKYFANRQQEKRHQGDAE